MTWGFCLDCVSLIVNIKASDCHTKQGWVINTLVKLAHGCQAITHNAYRLSASQTMSWYVTLVTTSGHCHWLTCWHCWWPDMHYDWQNYNHMLAAKVCVCLWPKTALNNWWGGGGESHRTVECCIVGVVLNPAISFVRYGDKNHQGIWPSHKARVSHQYTSNGCRVISHKA